MVESSVRAQLGAASQSQEVFAQSVLRRLSTPVGGPGGERARGQRSRPRLSKIESHERLAPSVWASPPMAMGSQWSAQYFACGANCPAPGTKGGLFPAIFLFLLRCEPGEQELDFAT